MNIVSSLRKSLEKHNSTEFKVFIEILSWLEGLNSVNNRIWDMLNKATHEESDKNDFDPIIVQEVLENLIQLETELHQKKVK